jgi:peptidoglycan/xylan/chitin deacetylase (PgdA/CDA1 family)
MMALLAVGILAIVAGILAWHLVTGPHSQALGAAISRGQADSGAVALTFEDGPGPETAPILDLLKREGVHATFFLCGANVEQYPELSRRISEEGHEIGNHTYHHSSFLGRSPGKIAWEIEGGQRAIRHRTGREAIWFRPPYGLRWFGLRRILLRSGLGMVLWSVKASDWKAEPNKIVDRVLRAAHPGAIVLLHDGSPPHQFRSRRTTLAALPRILNELQKRYRLVTVGKLLQVDRQDSDGQEFRRS